MSNRKGFNFLRSYYDVLEDIYSDTDKLTYLMAILDKQFKGIEPQLTGIPKLSYNGQKHNINKSVEGWESKTGEKLFKPTEDPYQDPTEGGSQGPTEDPTKGPTKGSYQHPSGDSVMTTEGPTEGPTKDPYLQEQEQEQEEEKEQEELKAKLNKEDKVSIHYIMDIENCSYDEALTLYLQQKELIFN